MSFKSDHRWNTFHRLLHNAEGGQDTGKVRKTEWKLLPVNGLNVATGQRYEGQLVFLPWPPSLLSPSPSSLLSLPSCEEEVALWEGRWGWGGGWWVSIDTWFCITVCVSASPLPPAEPRLVVSAPAKLLLCSAQQAGSDLCVRPPERRRRRRGACRDLSPPLLLTPACAVLLLQRSDLAGLPTQRCRGFSFLALNRCRLLLLIPLWWDVKYRCIETWTLTGHRYRPEQTIPTGDFLQSVNVKSFDFTLIFFCLYFSQCECLNPVWCHMGRWYLPPHWWWLSQPAWCWLCSLRPPCGRLSFCSLCTQEEGLSKASVLAGSCKHKAKYCLFSRDT